jgi:3-methyladenine DNA glycosylase AlkC
MEPFKNLLNHDLVRAAGKRMAAVWPEFPTGAFEKAALDGLDALEMKARAMQIAQALEHTLPADFDRACEVLEAALAPPIPVDGLASERLAVEQGLAGWIIWPLGEYVARAGIDHPQRALKALHALTQRLTAEFAIRPFIVAHPQLTLKTMLSWTRDPSPHVRRLASEGSRPRLPWGLRLQALVQDPSPTLPILEALQDDPSEYVRRSVANHLNDIAKDHPALVVAWVKKHLKGATPERMAMLKHASRGLVKAGHAPMLALWGVGQPFKGQAGLAVSPKKVAVGDGLELQLTLHSSARSPQKLLIDYAVHHVKANGGTSPKVFKGWNITLKAGEHLALRKKHSLREVTTRRYHAGRHLVEVLVNGQAVADAPFELRLNQ